MLDKNDKITEIETVINEKIEPYYTDIYSPWETKEQLRIWKEVTWTIGTQTKIIIVQNSTLWSISYTWLWFKPTTIEADFYCQNWSNSCFWHWYYSWWIYKTYQVYWWWSSSPWSYIASWQNAGWYIQASVTSLDKDWFTINYTWSTPPTIDIIFKCSK